MEAHTQLITSLSNSKSKKSIINHPLIHKTLITIVMNATVRNQIRASDVDRSIISSQIVQNWTPRIRKLTGTRKILKLMRIDCRKYIRHRKEVQIKVIQRRYTCLQKLCLPIQ